jgi:DNA-binding CsgD family transcriptional regulator
MLVARAVQEVRRTEIAALLDRAAQGHGGALVITGGPGEGKTHAVRTTPAGWTVVSVPGHPDESTLPYAGLQRVLDAGPAGRRGPCDAEDAGRRGPCDAEGPGRRGPCDADGAGRGRPCGGEPVAGDALRIALAVRARWQDKGRPILCVLDDFHLFDPETRRVLTLVAHRLDGTRAALLATAAEPVPGLPHHRLSPLTPAQSRRLLPPGLVADVAESLIDLAGGNPAALLDLVAALTPEQRRGYADPPVTLPPASPLRRRLLAGVAALPVRTREALLLAAAAPETLPDPDALAPAERAGLITVTGGTVAFVPPLLRSLVYHDAPLADRNEAHRRLAARGDPTARLLHRAAVATTPDDDLARSLLDAAATVPPDRARQARERAAALFTDPADAAAALAVAARDAALAGRPHEADRLLRRLTKAPALVRDRARAVTAGLRLREDPLTARDVLLDVAVELLPHDPSGAFEALLAAGDACGRSGDPGRFPAVARRAVAGHQRSPDPALRMAAEHVAGLADLLTGADATGFAHLCEALRLADRVTDPILLIAAATGGILTGRDRRGAQIAARAAALARTGGAVALVPAALEVAALAEFAAGRYEAATAAALDGVATAGRSGLAAAHHALLGLLAALMGDRATTLDRIHPDGDAAPVGDWAAGLLDLVEGRPAEAVSRLTPLAAPPSGRGSLLLRIAVTPHLIEAAVQAGVSIRPPGAFDRWAARTGESAWLALRARCRALGDPDAADDLFREALGWHRRDGSAFPAAHTALLYGRHLRRRRRHVEAREHLRRAAETFHRLDAGPWAAQAVQELRAAGERPRPEAAAARPALTAQQERIAGLVAGGATNREVAQQLQLSPRTVDHHLRNVFARLGVRSRTELARELTNAERAAAAAGTTGRSGSPLKCRDGTRSGPVRPSAPGPGS